MLEDKILEDYKIAMKQKDTLKASILNYLRSEMNYYAIEKKKDKLEDQDIIAVIKKQVKSHQDSIEQFEKGNRADLAEKEKKELEILKSYLPQELSEAELKNIVEEVINSFPDATIKDMGKIMKEIMVKTAGRADGKLVSELVRQRINKDSE
ncbi:MAG: GatB/YqeY domain-containing protein [Candidatus Omnitrophota bacterium]|nr:GatB/YqeY domain-containing protein [Candidatus Omnitrophota bacterium]